MDLVTIDFETYYDKEYSLSKITTEEYVRSDQFECIGVGIKINDQQEDFYCGPDVGRFLNGFDYSNAAILCHNTAFDGAILSWHYGIKPKMWFDTLSMARPLHNVKVGGSLAALAAYYQLGVKGDEVINALGKRKKDFTPEELQRYGMYCMNDVKLTYELFKKLRKGFPISELQVIDQTIRMYTEPQIVLDKAVLTDHLADVRATKQALLDKLGGHERARSILMSNEKFAGMLRRFGVEPPTKVSPKTGKTAYAFAKTDQEFLDLLEHPTPAVALLVEARLGTKSTIEETRTERLIGVAERGPLPIMLRYYGAHTGRFSGGDRVNLQNLPARKGNTIRRALCAPKGKKLIACDSSQIEARMVAYLAGQKDLVEAFRQGRDVYSEFASDVYGRKCTKADKTERFVGKTCILGLGYGMGHVKFRATLALGGVVVDEAEAQRIVHLYRNKYHKIAALWKVCDSALKDMVAGRSGNIGGMVPYDASGFTLPNGLPLGYAMLRSGDDGFEYINDARVFKKAMSRAVGNAKAEDVTFTKIYGGKVAENLVQALARIVVSEQMVAIGKHYPPLFQVHDEIIIAVPEQDAAIAKVVMMDKMSTPPAWAPTLPVACEAEIGDNYGDCK